MKSASNVTFAIKNKYYFVRCVRCPCDRYIRKTELVRERSMLGHAAFTPSDRAPAEKHLGSIDGCGEQRAAGAVM